MWANSYSWDEPSSVGKAVLEIIFLVLSIIIGVYEFEEFLPDVQGRSATSAADKSAALCFPTP